MTKLATLLGRRPTLVAETPPAPAAQPTPDKTSLELDQDLFFPVASQMGEENEVVRNLLIDAEHRITELETIKNSLGRLVDPVSKTLRAFEEAKTEKLSLQSTLNSTRIAYSKMREDLSTAEKRAATLNTECIRIRELLNVTQQSANSLEAIKTEQSAELTTRRAQIGELQRLVQKQATELQASRDESQRCIERVTAADRKMAQFESEAATATQKFLLADRERGAVQAQLDKSLNDAAQTTRRLAEVEKALAVTQTRLKQAELALTEAESSRIRLNAALEETVEAHRKEMIAQNSRLDATQARTQLCDQLLDESRLTLAARADEISAYDRRLAEATLARSAIESKFGQIEAALADRDRQIAELDEARSTLAERASELLHAVGTRESAYNRAQEKIQSQDDLIHMLESQIKGTRETYDLQIEELKAQVQREQLDRSMAEGALEAGRKDIARLLREIASMQLRPVSAPEPQAAAPAPAPARIQNAA